MATSKKTAKPEITQATILPDSEATTPVNAEVVPAENLDSGSNTAGAIVPFSAMIETELKKFDPITPAIKALEEEYLPLTIKGIDDAEGYDKVYKAYRFMVTKRTSVEAKRKELKADALAFGKAVDAKAAEITDSMAHIEEHLRKEKDRIDTERKAIEEEKERQKQEMIQKRKQELFAIGMRIGIDMEFVWEPTYLPSIGKENLPFINLETMSDEAFNSYVYMIQDMQTKDLAEKKRIDEEREAAEAKQREEQEALKKKEEEMEKEREKMRLEQKAMLDERYETRKMQLELMGLTITTHPFTSEKWFYYQGYQLFTTASIYNADATSYNSAKQLAADRIADLKQREEERQKELERIKEQVAEEERERQRKEKELADQQAEKERERQKELAEQQRKADELREEQEKEAAAQREQERLASLSDADKVNEYIAAINAIARPELKSKKGKETLRPLYEIIDSLNKNTD